jgi:hypothetical protein
MGLVSSTTREERLGERKRREGEGDLGGGRRLSTAGRRVKNITS